MQEPVKSYELELVLAAFLAAHGNADARLEAAVKGCEGVPVSARFERLRATARRFVEGMVGAAELGRAFRFWPAPGIAPGNAKPPAWLARKDCGLGE